MVVSARPAAAALPPRFVWKLGVVMLVLYFSAYLSEPFFAVYWESISGSPNKVLSGLVFAIPGVAALTALFVNSKTGAHNMVYRRDDGTIGWVEPR